MLVTRQRAATALISGALALSLVAAEGAGATSAAGTATSSMNAVTLTLSGVNGTNTLSLLDVATMATTDAAALGNAVAGNFASANVTPATVNGAAEGAQNVRSDQTESGTTSAIDLSGLGLPIDAVVLPIDVAATATEDGARAAVGAATASLSAITDLLGIEVSTAGIESVVTGESASQTQGVQVSGLEVTLGDLLPEELLAALPIDVLMDLLAELPVGAPDLQATVDQALALVANVEAGVNGIVASASGVENGIAAIEAAVTDLADQQAIVDGLEIDEAAAQAAVTNAVANVQAAVTAAADVEGSLAGVACVTDNLGNPTAAAACLDALQASADAAVSNAQAAAAAATATADQLAADLAEATSLLGPLAAVVDALTDIVDDLVDQLVQLVSNLLDDLNALLAALTDLSNSLGDVIDGLLNSTLIGLGNVDLSISAVSTGDVATSAAGVNCALSDLVVAGVNLGGGSCSGDSLVGNLLATVNSLDSVLGALPIVGNVAPAVTVDLMQISSSVTEADGVVTSTASVIPLVIDLPSIDIDPASLVDGLLEQLSTDLIDDLLASLPVPTELEGVGLDAAAAEIEALIGQDLPGLQDVEALIGDVLAQLPDGLGVPALTTPGFNLSIDPTSTASFAPAQAAPTAPAPDPLPATGGGMIALAIMGLGGAATLRRRR